MINSGIKRGLATIAVSALAVSGLGAFGGAAHADSIDAQQGATADVNFYTQNGVGASIANDGVNTTVSLVAGASADVKQVKFTYQVGSAAEQTIATVDRVNGAFSHQWTPPANIVGGSVTLKAVGLDAAGAVIAGAVDSEGSVDVHPGASDAVAIGVAAGSSVGAYETPGGSTKVVVSGTTNASAVTGLSGVAMGDPADGISAFAGVQDLGAYDWSAATPAVDEAILHVATTDSDDAVPVKLYKQTISAAGVSVAAAKSPLVSGETTDVTVTVVDQQGKPVAGALVADSSNNTQVPTNAKGEAVFEDYAASTTAYEFHVDLSATPGFDNGTDIQKSVTIGSYTPGLESLAATATHAVLDADEIGADTFKVAGKDQNGAAFTPLPASLRGTWTFAPTTGNAPAPVAAVINPATGEVEYPTAFAGLLGVATLNVRNEVDGDPQPSAGDLQAPALEVKVGQAELTWDADNNNVQAAAGTDVTVKGTLALGDGTVLAGRTVELNIAAGTPAGDAAFAPTADQPTGVTVAGGVATVKTAADGSFSVKVRDPKVPATTPPAPPAEQPTELDVTISVVPGSLGLAASDLDIDFQDLAVETIGLSATNLFDSKATPGRPVEYTGVVENAAGEVLSNTAVELSLDKGFFVDFDKDAYEDGADLKDTLTPEGQEQGEVWGDWKSAGTTASVVTDENGEFTVVVGIEGDDDFNDDFEADVTLTAVAGGKTQTDKTTFSSTDALNVASVELAHAADQGSYGSTVLPKASTDRQVLVDVKATDQFGNPTDADVTIAAGDDSVGSQPASAEGGETVVITSTTAGIQSFTATVNEDANTWNDSVNNVDPAPNPAETPVWERDTDAVAADDAVKSDALDTEWYVVDLEAGTYTLSHSGDEWNAVGSIVTAFFEAKDQEGAPIRDLEVDFFRAGPGAVLIPWLGGSAYDYTDNDGKASVYFQGEQEGTAVISTVVIDDRGGPTDGDRVLAGTQSIDIKFGEEPVVEPPVVEPPVEDEPIDLNVKLKGKNNGKKKDKVKVIIKPVGEAAGAKVVLQRKNANGKWKKVAVKKANDSKKVVFKVKDRNGKKKTAYRAKIRKTATTNAATTNNKRIR